MQLGAHVRERRRARAAVAGTCRCTPRPVDAGPGHVDLHRAGRVAEIPHDDRAVGGRQRRFGGEVDPRRRPVVDERSQRHVDARQVVEPGAHGGPCRGGDAGDDVTIRRELPGIHGDRRRATPAVAAGEPERGVHGLVEVDGGRVVHDHRAGGGADDRAQTVADTCRQVDPVLPRADERVRPLLLAQCRRAGRASPAAPCRASCRRGRGTPGSTNRSRQLASGSTASRAAASARVDHGRQSWQLPSNRDGRDYRRRPCQLPPSIAVLALALLGTSTAATAAAPASLDPLAGQPTGRCQWSDMASIADELRR